MRQCVLVNGLPGCGKTTIGRGLADDLGLPLFSKDRVKDLLVEAAGHEVAAERLSAWGNEALWALVGSSPAGAVAETWFGPTGYQRVHDGLTSAGIDTATAVVEVWCECPVAVAKARFMARLEDPSRHPRHNNPGLEDAWWADLDDAQPLGFPRLVRAHTGGAAPDRQALAHQVRQLLDG